MDYSTPDFSVLYYLPELAQTHVHWAGDAIQPSPPRSSLSSPAFNLSQHRGLFQWVSHLCIIGDGSLHGRSYASKFWQPVIHFCHWWSLPICSNCWVRERREACFPYRPILTPTLAEVSSVNSRELSAFSPHNISTLPWMLPVSFQQPCDLGRWEWWGRFTGARQILESLVLWSQNCTCPSPPF